MGQAFRLGLERDPLCPGDHSRTETLMPPMKLRPCHVTLDTLGFSSLEGSFSGFSGQTHSHLLFQILKIGWLLPCGNGGEESRRPL